MGPELENTDGLERPEYAVWVRFLAAETVLSQRSYRAQEMLVKLLDRGPERGPWCGHEDCEAARTWGLESLTRRLWKTPPAG